MLSLLEREGIPRGTGSGSCNAGRTELPDLGTDIEDGHQRSFAIDTICAQEYGQIWLRLTTPGMLLSATE